MQPNERILVLCTGNSCRSQMAEGYLRHFGNERIQVRSAGLEAHGLNPRAVKVMAEDGIDISGHSSDRIDPDGLQWASLVITVCGHADQHCPAVPGGVEKRHIPFPDPAKETGSEREVLPKFREVRDRIRSAMLELVRELEQRRAV